jgi:4-amino-4-deoxy-L-arabinose transferase-like glycosyltransferase
LTITRSLPGLLGAALLASWCVGMLGRGYWTPDEPREADISWRMSSQADRAVPLLAGEAFCEKPPLTYWLAGASIRAFGDAGWAARLPNLLYAIVTALSVAWLTRRSAGPLAATAAAAAGATFLLSYQVAIWLATDAPLLAAVSVALLGAYAGFYAEARRERLCGYLLMHAALGIGFLAKSAAAWMVPALAVASLMIWERRWREALRWELWIGLSVQAAIIGAWVWFVYRGPQGPLHLKIFFWNNLVGRFTHIDAPADLQYAAAHQNSPGKYLLELPIYLFPWTLLVVAAARRAWRQRHGAWHEQRAVRFALAASLPALAVLSVAATARNIYLAPALPGVALLLGWWTREAAGTPERADVLALRATAGLMLLAILVAIAAVAAGCLDAWPDPGSAAGSPLLAVAITGLGASVSVALALYAWRAAGRAQVGAALLALLLAYCSLLVGPGSQAYRLADRWQDLGSIGRAVKIDVATSPLVLVAPDETTRAWVDQYVSTTVVRIAGPMDGPAAMLLGAQLRGEPRGLALVQLEGREMAPQLQDLARRLGIKRDQAVQAPAWLAAAHVQVLKRYSLPNGRRYALLERAP